MLLKTTMDIKSANVLSELAYEEALPVHIQTGKQHNVIDVLLECEEKDEKMIRGAIDRAIAIALEIVS